MILGETPSELQFFSTELRIIVLKIKNNRIITLSKLSAQGCFEGGMKALWNYVKQLDCSILLDGSNVPAAIY